MKDFRLCSTVNAFKKCAPNGCPFCAILLAKISESLEGVSCQNKCDSYMVWVDGKRSYSFSQNSTSVILGPHSGSGGDSGFNDNVSHVSIRLRTPISDLGFSVMLVPMSKEALLIR